MAALRILSHPSLWKAAGACISSILRNFFLLQYRGALFRGTIPISHVDHPLDDRIPFCPDRVGTYLDFTAFWIRALGFLLKVRGKAALPQAREFLVSLGEVYAFAAQVYRVNLSTTRRPRYLRSPRFMVIHAFDPHLMCIPSLHVMVVIRTYTFFRKMLTAFGDGERFAPEIEEFRRGALEITESVLFVKQHSVNCIAAAMYAMTRFDRELFPPEEADSFCSALFQGLSAPAATDQALIRDYILTLYRGFLADGETSSWEEPLLEFLRTSSAPPADP